MVREMDSCDFLGQVENAVRRRSKSLRYRGAELECVSLSDAVSNGAPKNAQAEIILTYPLAGTRGVRLRLQLWNDRWCWLDIRCASKKGWLWIFRKEGRYAGEKWLAELMAGLEASIDVFGLNGVDVKNSLHDIWDSKLAGGPRVV